MLWFNWVLLLNHIESFAPRIKRKLHLITTIDIYYVNEVNYKKSPRLWPSHYLLDKGLNFECGALNIYKNVLFLGRQVMLLSENYAYVQVILDYK